MLWVELPTSRFAPRSLKTAPASIMTVNALPASIPLLIKRDGVVLTTLLLLATALVGVAFSGRKIVSIDPLIALGQQQ